MHRLRSIQGLILIEKSYYFDSCQRQEVWISEQKLLPPELWRSRTGGSSWRFVSESLRHGTCLHCCGCSEWRCDPCNCPQTTDVRDGTLLHSTTPSSTDTHRTVIQQLHLQWVSGRHRPHKHQDQLIFIMRQTYSQKMGVPLHVMMRLIGGVTLRCGKLPALHCLYLELSRS